MSSMYICRVCKSAIDSKICWRYFGFQWAHCLSCKTTQKLLTPQEYNNINPTYDPGMYIEDVDSVSTLRHQLFVNEKIHFLTKHAGSDLDGKRFLDIGCGLGGFLIAAQELGMIASGYEPSKLHSSQLEKIYPRQFKVVNDYFDSSKCDGTYDIIMLSHVIEHIYDQKAFISGICSKLSVGGLLLVITPNNESVEASISGRRWLMYKPVDHVSLIGPTAAKMLTPVGCVIAALQSDEYRGEFAVHMLSALKTALGGGKATGKLAAGESPRKQVSAASFPPWLKAILQILSLPFWVYGKITNGLACMTIAYRRTS